MGAGVLGCEKGWTGNDLSAKVENQELFKSPSKSQSKATRQAGQTEGNQVPDCQSDTPGQNEQLQNARCLSIGSPGCGLAVNAAVRGSQ